MIVSICEILKRHDWSVDRRVRKLKLPENSVMEVISWKNMPIFTEIILLLIRQNTIPYGQRHY